MMASPPGSGLDGGLVAWMFVTVPDIGWLVFVFLCPSSVFIDFVV